MRKVSIACFILFVAASCTHKETFKVDGIVPDAKFDGSKVYLVALDGPISKNVDSTILLNGRFHFEKRADSLCIKILRIPFRLPDIVEDLVVVTEPGTLNAELSTNSHGSGIPLNEKLQSWKDKKHAFDMMQASIYSLIRESGADTVKIDSLRKYSEKLSMVFKADVRKVMNENLRNGIGLLLFKVYYYDLSAEEKKSILAATGNLYPDKDAQLKLMIRNDQSLSK